MVGKSIKFTKSELRKNQSDFLRLNRFLPTIKTKKQILKLFIQEVTAKTQKAEQAVDTSISDLEPFHGILGTEAGDSIMNIIKDPKIDFVSTNVAGTVLKMPKKVTFNEVDFCKYSVPWGVDAALKAVKHFGECLAIWKSLKYSLFLITEELNKSSIRANLFENVLMPRFTNNILKISAFLMDQDILALSQVKTMKKNINIKRANESTSK